MAPILIPSADMDVNAFRGVFELAGGITTGDLQGNETQIRMNFDGNGQSTDISAISDQQGPTLWVTTACRVEFFSHACNQVFALKLQI